MESKTKNYPPTVEGLDDDAAMEVLIAEFEHIDNRDSHSIMGSSEFKTVNEMLDHMRRKTPAGLRILELYRKAEVIMREAVEQQRDRGVVGGLRRLLNLIRVGDATELKEPEDSGEEEPLTYTSFN